MNGTEDYAILGLPFDWDCEKSGQLSLRHKCADTVHASFCLSLPSFSNALCLARVEARKVVSMLN
jgi:hypothetical protein